MTKAMEAAGTSDDLPRPKRFCQASLCSFFFAWEEERYIADRYFTE
jgi:hypothetical protein